MKKIKSFFTTIWQKIKAIPTKTKIIYSSLIIVFLAIGGFAGYIVSGIIFKNGANYDNISENQILSIEDDSEALLKRFSSANINSDLTSTFTPVELVEISLAKFSTHTYIRSTQYGLVTAMGVDQTVRTSSIKNGENYFLEDISNSSLVHAARRFYQSGDEVKDYEGSNVTQTKATWSDSKCTIRNIEEHTKKWGKDLSRPLIYIISSKTANGNVVKTDSEYHVSLSLDKDLSTIRYAKQMLSISPIDNPVFDSLDIQLILNKNLDLISYHTEEHYKVDMIVSGVSSHGRLSEYFTYDEQTAIPDLTTNITYEEGENLYEKVF